MPEVLTLNQLKYAFSPLPEEYWDIPVSEREERCWTARRRLGKDVLVLAHNYQRDEIVVFADFTGDSFQLSKFAAKNQDARIVIFCGVSFMAETVDILCEGRKTVILPSMEASCPMAGMAELVQVQKAWEEVIEFVPEEEVLPVTYINSYADLKAFTAKHHGAICTSSNALAVFQWALKQKKRIFFYPDQNLGLNIWLKAGQEEGESLLWNPWESTCGGNTPQEIEKARLFLWRGFCQVHDRFKVEHVQEMRAKYPDIRILVHPECVREVVDLADVVGSTSEIIRTVQKAPPGTRWAIGTEFHLVNRLKQQHPEQFILPLGCEVCIDCNAMQQIDPNYLLWVMEELAKGQVHNAIRVEEEDARWARLALQRMLALV